MPGKTVVAVGQTIETHLASMRPQRNAGENMTLSSWLQAPQDGFNEAPAKCRGKPVPHVPPDNGILASMRPQRNAGENATNTRINSGWRLCFNEAPAKCRGKPIHEVTGTIVLSGASMRPQRNAGENEQLTTANSVSVDKLQ